MARRPTYRSTRLAAEADDEEEADEEDDDDALAFVSEPDDEDDAESDDFEAVDAGVLLDEEPRLSFR